MRSTSARSALVRYSGTPRCGHVILAGRSFIYLASRSGPPTKDLPRREEPVSRMVKLHLHDSGDAQAAIYQRTNYQRPILVGAARKQTLDRRQAYHLTPAVTLVGKTGCGSALTLVSSHAMPDLVCLVRTWDRPSPASVARMRSPNDVSILTMRTAGAVRRFAATLCLAGSTLVLDLVTKAYVEHARSLLMLGAIAARSRSKSDVMSRASKQQASAETQKIRPIHPSTSGLAPISV